ncbi:MAG: hypothetical protein QXH39_01195 [Conexivisphaerales archaeon]
MQPDVSYDGGEEKRCMLVMWERCRAAIMGQHGRIINEFSFDNDQDGISYLSLSLSTDDIVME